MACHIGNLIEILEYVTFRMLFTFIFLELYFEQCLNHGDEPYRILVVQNRILFVISGLYLCKSVFVGRGKYPENHM